MTNKFLLGVVLAIFSVVGYVVLALSGQENLEEARGVFLFATPFIALLLGSSAYEQIKEQQSRVEDKADDAAIAAKTAVKQTNGALSQKIEETAELAAAKAVNAYIVANQPPPINPDKETV